MSDPGDGSYPYQTGYITPSSSPTKTVSSADWLSPRTPCSPRKSRSCLFIRDIDHGSELPFVTPPPSPTRSRRLFDYLIPEAVTSVQTLSPWEADSPVKQQIMFNGIQAASRLKAGPLISQGKPQFLLSHEFENDSVPDMFALPGCVSSNRKCHSQNVSEGAAIHSEIQPSADSIASVMSCRKVGSPVPTFSPIFCTIPPLIEGPNEKMELSQLPLRNVNSPLRSSQWVARGGLLSSPRNAKLCTPDRFIATRRPPAIARDSFKLKKSSERLAVQHTPYRSRAPNGDPFARRLQRSRRLNDELHGLREAHSVITGRAGAYRRNTSLSYRRNLFESNARQVSAGAIWNVGGPSAVSDTVAGVSSGSGGILGIGTNAPLYRSAFLNRSDPEAELEAYKCRLALALDVDQTERVLRHFSTFKCLQAPNHWGATSNTAHTWRDGAWVKEKVTSSLFLSVPKRSHILY